MSDDDHDKPAGAPPAPSPAEPAFAPQPIEDRGLPRPGLSFSPGLRPVPNSQAPATARGDMVPHVYGPQQAAVDPIAAGLDTEHNPMTRAENRIVTQTGAIGAGPRPSTYAEKPGEPIPQAGPEDGGAVRPAPDAAHAAAPGPSGASEAPKPV